VEARGTSPNLTMKPLELVPGAAAGDEDADMVADEGTPAPPSAAASEPAPAATALLGVSAAVTVRSEMAMSAASSCSGLSGRVEEAVGSL
jgi:hypothetical protein